MSKTQQALLRSQESCATWCGLQGDELDPRKSRNGVSVVAHMHKQFGVSHGIADLASTACAILGPVIFHQAHVTGCIQYLSHLQALRPSTQQYLYHR